MGYNPVEELQEFYSFQLVTPTPPFCTAVPETSQCNAADLSNCQGVNHEVAPGQTKQGKPIIGLSGRSIAVLFLYLQPGKTYQEDNCNQLFYIPRTSPLLVPASWNTA